MNFLSAGVSFWHVVEILLRENVIYFKQTGFESKQASWLF
jgi:hypothetical protein